MLDIVRLLLSVTVLLTAHYVTVDAEIQLLVIGDWGDDTDDQVAVANAMSEWCSPTVRGPCQFVLNTGDNFYSDGVDSPTHPRFNTTWRWIYDKPNIDQLVWYNSLGNHDYGVLLDPEFNQVAYGETDPLWYLPWLWYDFFKIDPESGAVVHFVVTDSQSLIFLKHDPDRQRAWIEEVIKRSTADWVILLSHYPPYSSGDHAPGNIVMREQLVLLCEKYGVDMFLAGHEHNMEHLTKPGATDYVISGGGGRRLYGYSPAGERVLNGWNVTLDYFGEHHGFLDMRFTKTTMNVEYIDENMDVQYAFSRTK